MIQSALWMSYIVFFCRITLGLIFVISSIEKARHIQSFEEAIANFNLLPKRLNKISAYTFVIAEFVTVILLILGGAVLVVGFTCAALLLITFSGALFSSLHRKIEVKCNCFGPSQTVISGDDLWRNGGFLLSALLGIAFSLPNSALQPLNLLEGAIVTLAAVAFTVLWANISSVIWLFRKPNKV